ncbi:bifunctional diguanylate cyclase/phosphohydrolase [Aquibacillus rhizosphaerae]|uniref:Diguanylate cyclase n=1 Tax=Aquibacillus rhizosphaerae TaxID=3051431 RepID=A0ABT7L3L4_9BACI|nr:diguanylate cyclase [Aquibacillus sp. LR5S19]MDL4840448.1 diguanylate cyclase [Aquibacillus sp. LR5S19]
MEFMAKKNIYVTCVSILGIVMFLLHGDFSFVSLSEWVLGFALIGATLILIHFQIQLPPEGNFLSMDSAIYLACIFVFGIKVTLVVLFFSSLVNFFYERETKWWKHIFNFSTYTLMIIGGGYTFILTGGSIGVIHQELLFSYLLAMVPYFLVNVILIGFFFWIAKKQSLLTVFKGMIAGTVETYISTLLLSLVLGFLLQSSPFFGLALFVGIAVLLSFIFRQHFKLYQTVRNKANIDHLTGLKNHGYFKEVLTNKLLELKQSQATLSLAMLDIDDFKKYNDGNGHLKGDHLLTFFGQLLEKACSKYEYTVARFGGEEFVIMMPNTNQYEAASFIDHLRKDVNDTYFEGVELLPYGCLSYSAGIMEWNKEILNASEYISHADQAMYYAKKQGKNNTHIYGNEIDSISIDKPMKELEQQLNILLAKDIYTYRHSKRVFKYAVEFSKHLDITDHEKKVLILGALIHDIGKIEVPRDVINKKGKLNADEWELVKKHVTWGKDIVSLNKKYQEIVPLVELHHERYDGKGYPHGLKEEETPKLARILCIIDSFDAMTTERPYQKTKSYREAITELSVCSGTQFDPFYVEGFIDFIENNYIEDEKKESTTI